jgi:flagellar M-ring protein FliF
MEELKDFFDLPFGEGNYSVNVSATLNYDAMTQEEVEYYPSGDDNTGVLDHSKDITEASALDSDEGLVGVTPNADESPDYPTYTGLEDGQSYYYNLDENQYDVSYIKTNLEKDGYSIENLSVALMINTNSLTETEREAYADLVAKAAGTTVDNVSVFNTVFALGNGGGTTAGDNSTSISIRQPDSYRDMLLYIVVILGILLIVLLIVSLFMSKSRKRKIKHRQEQALAAAASGNAQFGSSSQEPEQPEEVDFNIASLTEEAGKDSKETILKREIAEFSKSSPEIVAQIIRNMLREDS